MQPHPFNIQRVYKVLWFLLLFSSIILLLLSYFYCPSFDFFSPSLSYGRLLQFDGWHQAAFQAVWKVLFWYTMKELTLAPRRPATCIIHHSILLQFYPGVTFVSSYIASYIIPILLPSLFRWYFLRSTALCVCVFCAGWRTNRKADRFSDRLAGQPHILSACHISSCQIQLVRNCVVTKEWREREIGKKNEIKMKPSETLPIWKKVFPLKVHDVTSFRTSVSFSFINGSIDP